MFEIEFPSGWTGAGGHKAQEKTETKIKNKTY